MNADPEIEEDVERRYDLTSVTLDPGHGDRYRDTVLTGVDLGSLEKLGVMGKRVDQSTAPGQLEGRQLDAPASHLLCDPIGPLPEEPADGGHQPSLRKNAAEQEHDESQPASPPALTTRHYTQRSLPASLPPSSGRGDTMNTSPAVCGSEANITPAPATRKSAPTRPLKKACSSDPGLL
jgi:hypothetical protein